LEQVDKLNHQRAVGVVNDVGDQLAAAASVFTRVMSWPPGARTIST